MAISLTLTLTVLAFGAYVALLVVLLQMLARKAVDYAAKHGSRDAG